MRVMVKFRIPTESGTAALKSGRIGQLLPQLLEELKPEAAYFYPEDGLRSGHFIVDASDGKDVLSICERFWFALGGEAQMIPVMTPQDIQSALGSIDEISKKYG
jgi:hypothetical protein